MSRREFNNLGTLCCLLQLESSCHWFSTLTVGIGKQGTVAELQETPFLQKVFLYFYAFHFVDELCSNNKSRIPANYKKEIGIAFLVQRLMKAWTTVRERRNIRLEESVAQFYFLRDWKLESFLVPSIDIKNYSPLVLQKTLTGSLKPVMDETPHPQAVSNHPKV